MDKRTRTAVTRATVAGILMIITATGCETPTDSAVLPEQIFTTEGDGLWERDESSFHAKATSSSTTTAVLAGRFTDYTFTTQVRAELPLNSYIYFISDATNQLSLKNSEKNQIEIDLNRGMVRVSTKKEETENLTNPEGDGWVEAATITGDWNTVKIKRNNKTITVAINGGEICTVEATSRYEGFIGMGMRNETEEAGEVEFKGWRLGL